MAVNKIIYNKKTLIDLTNDTVTADKLFKGVLAHDKSGNQIVGTFEQSLPTGTKTITANGSYDVTDYATAKVNVPVPSGYVKPSGTKYITTTSSVDVTSYANAQIQSSTLIAENIKKDVSILGVTGTYEGSGGGGGGYGEYVEVTINLTGNISVIDYSSTVFVAYLDPWVDEFSRHEMTLIDTLTTEVRPSSIITLYMFTDDKWAKNLSELSFSVDYTGIYTLWEDYMGYSKMLTFVSPPANSTGVITINITKN